MKIDGRRRAPAVRQSRQTRTPSVRQRRSNAAGGRVRQGRGEDGSIPRWALARTRRAAKVARAVFAGVSRASPACLTLHLPYVHLSWTNVQLREKFQRKLRFSLNRPIFSARHFWLGLVPEVFPNKNLLELLMQDYLEVGHPSSVSKHWRKFSEIWNLHENNSMSWLRT